MHVVVNHLRFASPPPRSAIDSMQGDAGERLRAIEGFEAVHLCRVDDEHYILIVQADSAATLERISQEVGGPWVTEHLAPHFAGPPDRSVAEVVGSATRS